MPPFFAGAFLVWISCAAYSDCQHRRVTNQVMVLGLLLGLASVAAGDGYRQLLPTAERLDCLIGLLVGTLVMMPAFVLRIAGASDVKFLAVVGLWLGYQPLLWTWVIASLLAMLHAGVYLLAALRTRAGAPTAISGWSVNPVRGIPYVSYLAIGAAATVALALSQSAVGLS